MRIIHYPNEILRFKSKPMQYIDKVDRQLVDKMFDVMGKANGIGLAAIQVCWPTRLFVLNVEGQKHACINPEITSKSEEQVTAAESCLSFPGKSVMVKRAARIRFQFFNLDQKRITCVLDGMIARVVQHEVDHLDGILIVDKEL